MTFLEADLHFVLASSSSMNASEVLIGETWGTISLSNSYNYLINDSTINSTTTRERRLIFHVRLFDNCVTFNPVVRKQCQAFLKPRLRASAGGEVKKDRKGNELMVLAGLCHYLIGILSFSSPKRSTDFYFEEVWLYGCDFNFQIFFHNETNIKRNIMNVEKQPKYLEWFSPSLIDLFTSQPSLCENTWIKRENFHVIRNIPSVAKIAKPSYTFNPLDGKEG